MNKIDESQLKNMKADEIFKLRRHFADNRDIESLLTIAKHRFVRGSAATNESNFPEMCYYFGRLQRLKEFEEFLSDKSFYLAMLPKSCLILAQNLLPIGVKFPNLEEQEITYLEEKYSDPVTFELFDIIMFDADRLPRPIKKFE